MRTVKSYNIMDAKAADGVGKNIFVQDFITATLSLFTASSANLTLKVQISNQDDSPNFATAASPTNQWSYVKLVNLLDSSSEIGSTGLVMSGTDISAQYEVNVNGVKWLNAVISSYVAGTVTLDVALYDNQ